MKRIVFAVMLIMLFAFCNTPVLMAAELDKNEFKYACEGRGGNKTNVTVLINKKYGVATGTYSLDLLRCLDQMRSKTSGLAGETFEVKKIVSMFGHEGNVGAYFEVDVLKWPDVPMRK